MNGANGRNSAIPIASTLSAGWPALHEQLNMYRPFHERVLLQKKRSERAGRVKCAQSPYPADAARQRGLDDAADLWSGSKAEERKSECG